MSCSDDFEIPKQEKNKYPWLVEVEAALIQKQCWEVIDPGYEEEMDERRTKLEHLVESGIVMYSLRKGLPDTEICPLDLGSKERQLQNTDLLMTYYIVAGGFIVSTIAFAGELLCTKCSVRIKSYNAAGSKNLFTISKKTKKGVLNEDHLVPPPPPYHALFKPPFPHSENAKTKTINGRDYWVVKSTDGDTRLIPIRAPSAFLFQYDN